MYENKREKHAIRKFSVGTASIVIGGLIYGFMGDNEAQASETSFNNLGENKVEFNAQNPQAPQQTYTEVTIKENQTSESKALEYRNSQPEEKAKVEVVENEQPKIKSSVEENTVTDAQRQAVAKNEESSSEAIQQPKKEATDVEPQKKLYREVQPNTNAHQTLQAKNKNDIASKDISSQVEVESADIKGFNNSNTIRPHQGQGGKLQYKLKFPQDVKSGDTFKIQLSDNVNTHGISVERNAPNIVTKNEQGREETIAEGNVLEDGRTILYTFKDYVNGKQNLTADLSISYFTSPENVKGSGPQLIESKIGTDVTSSDIYIHYDNSHYVDGRISELNKKEGKFKQIAYINPYGYLNGRGTVSVNGDVVSGAPKASTNPKVSIYKYKGQGYPPASIYLEPNMWEEVIMNNNLINYNNNGSYSLSLDIANNQKYAIKYEGLFDSDAEKLLYRTYIQGYYNGYYPFSFEKINGVKFYENNASGSGELKPVPPKPNPEVHNNLVEATEDSNVIDISWDTALDEENGENKGPQEEITENNDIEVTEEHNLIENTEDTMTEEESGQNEGSEEEIEENQITDIIEDTTPEGESGQNEGSQEEVEENQVIDIIADTTPEGERGQNEGSQEEVEENQVIDIIADTTPEGERGQNEGNQEKVEEHQIIDIIEDTTPEGESGQNEGSQEEVEENQIIDIIEDTTPEGESGQNEGNQEEIKEHQIIDIIEDTTPEGESGQNEGNQEEIEEHQIIDIIEDTTPEGESGQNEGNQEEVEENQVIDIIEDTTPEGESGQNEGNQEEVEEHQVIDRVGGKAPERKGGQIEGNQEKIEEHPINVPVIHVSTSMHKNANSKSVKVLPSTGEAHKNTPTLAIILTAIGSVLLFRRKSKFNKAK
ncbi:Ig-like domain-containing protein [Staphylococcus coagulans]|uniref:Ig-like domain-containing protein n=1 Tax=Staphylococcus coagulans TaxID=74706 RepID=UPI001F4BDB5E|nr:Ig-like domain-containing protein [Staphylococcus coagulans]MDU9268822.1 Ig-like domain-containing protein [Staphylococcus coagulans]MDU9280629.1 Ig-like domain-containing protein [Staphylococcus coagulans]MDU9292689.1 Ig-like domain-containing protein [Staphylococcus coagulans]MDU9305039.1 Ig-like domain-containing protein [Staphylococcus coagulans]MDU9322127.1 Ig-like domain-containing protein [Staphylococcus coagulans]